MSEWLGLFLGMKGRDGGERGTKKERREGGEMENRV